MFKWTEQNLLWAFVKVPGARHLKSLSWQGFFFLLTQNKIHNKMMNYTQRCGSLKALGWQLNDEVCVT